MERKNVIVRAKKLSKWFEVDLSIKIFGVEIFHWHFPPLDSNPSEDELKNV